MKNQVIQMLEFDDFPAVAEELDAACEHRHAVLVFIDTKFYNALKSAMEKHSDQVVSIIESLASPHISEFSFEAQRKPVRIWKKIIKQGGSQ